jgi:hypothetical protein
VVKVCAKKLNDKYLVTEGVYENNPICETSITYIGINPVQARKEVFIPNKNMKIERCTDVVLYWGSFFSPFLLNIKIRSSPAYLRKKKKRNRKKHMC